MKKKNLLIKILCILMLSVLYISRDGKMVGFLAALLILYLVTFKVINVITAKYLTAEIKSTPDESDKNCNHINITVKNGSFIPVFNSRITVKVHNIITDNCDCCSWNIAVGPKGEKEFSFGIKDDICGAMEAVADEIEVSDFFGILKSKCHAKTCAMAYVLPEMRELPVSSEDISKYDMESFKYSATKKGNDSSETFGINIYKPGDSVKTIHWKLSGKMDNIVVRELGLPIENKLMILVDKSVNGQEDFNGKKKSEATSLAASLSYTFAKRGVHHHVGWYNERRKEFEFFKIQGETNIWEYLPVLLASPFYKKGDSAAVKFIEAEVEKDFSNFVLVSNSEADMERLMNYGEVNIYNPEEFKKK